MPAKRPISKKQLFATRLTRAKFTSPCTLGVFARPIQEQLRDSIARRPDVTATKCGALDKYQYWLTMPQALRQFNTMPRFGAAPTKVTNGASNVVPLEALKDLQQHYVLQTYPPFFSTGVGIFFDWKWHKVAAPAMVKHLNPSGKDRALFLDVDACEDNGFDVSEKHLRTIELAGICDKVMYCADQMEHPHKVFPTRGLALNPTTARRFAQPGHDVLVTASLLRGYVSPFWLTETQITRFYRTTLDKKFASDFVEVPGRTAVLVKLSALPKDIAAQVLHEYPPPPASNREGLTMALDGGNWEVVLHETVLLAMAKKCTSPEELAMWVSLSTLRYLSQKWNAKAPSWSFVNLGGNQAAALKDFLNSNVDRDGWLDQAPVTTMRLYNAECAANPRMILPQRKNIALTIGGSSIHSRFVSLVMKHAHHRHYLSPIWMTPLDVLRVPGLGVKNGEKPLEISAASQPREMLYNVADLEPESVRQLLAKRPAPSDAATAHYTFVISWQQVQSVARQRLLTAAKREQQLWLSHAEIVLNGLMLKAEAVPVQLTVGSTGRSRDKKGGGDGVRKLYNAEQTTDPVRVTALSLMKTTYN